MAEEFAAPSLIHGGIAERREYQERIVQTRLRENTLIILPTGLGKTVIAAMVAIERLRTFPDGRILGWAPTKPLVEQHCMRFKEFLNRRKYNVSSYSSC